MADVKDSKLRTLIVFVGGNLVTAFGFSSRQAAARGLEEPARSWGQEALGARGSVWDGLDRARPGRKWWSVWPLF